MALSVAESASQFLSLLAAFARRPRLHRTLASALLVAALLSGFVTYVTLSGAFGIQGSIETVQLLLLLDLVLLLMLGVVVAWQLVILWLERRRGLIGARLHLRLVGWFSLAAITPTIIIAVFSVLFFAFGMDKWFSDRVRTAVRDSLIVAQAYLREHQESVGYETVAMATDLRREGPLSPLNRDRLERLMTVQSRLRSLDEAAIIDGHRQVLASAELSFVLQSDLDIADDKLESARDGEVVILPSPTEDRVRAVMQLDADADTFLYTSRLVDPKVIAHMDKAKGAALLYEQLEGQRFSIQTIFALIFIVVALLLLFAAVWSALLFAGRLVRPISTLVAAAGQIGSGALETRVPEGAPDDELGTLSRAFNRMTEQIESQRNELVTANRQLEERRRFTEVVLAGVSAGVVGLDQDGLINLPNRSASDLLAIDLMTRLGEPISAVVPEMASLVEAARQRPSWIAESQISLVRGAETRTLLVRVVAEFMSSRLIGFVVTFDDVTELLSAQRKAAWADVARRIAHEIKNPLTPIQLSAERLKRRYLKEITSDPETFETCTDTIVRQVRDIGRMVDEFSAFARMPAPVMAEENLVELCRQAIFLQQNANPGIEYATDFPPHPASIACDARQVGQALTNILKNAAESIEARLQLSDQAEPPGRIQVIVRENADDLVIDIEDNGRGLPVQGRERLTEPYVTTRTKGTGLGLAIVKKIMEDHGGFLLLDDRP
ncbi:MAG TPA: PAS domain-containing sensor histidine kinase, partial [Dongiaceae bacterium]|nr:PAS domain-containing sensor histidine kinase [Dongiaceae bacterium]